MDLIDAKLLWTPEEDLAIVKMGETETPLQRSLRKSDWAPWGWWREASPDRRAAYMFGSFSSLIISHGFDVDQVHKVFMAVEEYRQWHEDRGIFIQDTEQENEIDGKHSAPFDQSA
jgi:hypothetical protein